MADEHSLILSSEREEFMKKIELIQGEHFFEKRKSVYEDTQRAYEKCLATIAREKYHIGWTEFKEFSGGEHGVFSQIVEECATREVKKVIVCWACYIALYPALVFLLGDTPIGAICLTLNAVIGTIGAIAFSAIKSDFYTFLRTKKKLRKMDQQKALEVGGVVTLSPAKTIT